MTCLLDHNSSSRFPCCVLLVLSWDTNENPSTDKLSRAINYITTIIRINDIIISMIMIRSPSRPPRRSSTVSPASSSSSSPSSSSWWASPTATGSAVRGAVACFLSQRNGNNYGRDDSTERTLLLEQVPVWVVWECFFLIPFLFPNFGIGWERVHFIDRKSKRFQ